MEAKPHWDRVYRTRRANEVSWFQREPALSHDLIRRVAPDRATSLIDVGAGASLLVDTLLADGYSSITALDVSGEALRLTQARLAAAADAVRWIEADVQSAPLPPAAFDVWHDRAVFHFLTDPADRAAYVAQVERSVCAGGHVIVATFAEDGPITCSGLPVARYSAEALHQVFGPSFQLLESHREVHVTPSGGRQSFVYCVFRHALP